MSRRSRKQGYDSNYCGIVDIKTTYDYFMYRLMTIATSCFTWHGLPETVNQRFLETRLINDGHMLYFIDDIMGELALRCTISAPFNVYDVPRKRRAYASNGYQRDLTEHDSVIIYDNLLQLNIIPTLSMFAKRLTNLEITKDINVRAQKTPVMIQCDDGQRLTMENLFMKIDCGSPVIFGTKNLDLESVKVLDLKAPYVVDKLNDEKMAIMREAFSFLGVGSLDIDKKERLIRSEVQVTQEANVAQRAGRLKARKEACKEINEMFYDGLEVVTVEYDPTAEQLALELMREEMVNSETDNIS